MTLNLFPIVVSIAVGILCHSAPIGAGTYLGLVLVGFFADITGY